MNTKFSKTKSEINKIDFLSNKYGIDKLSNVEKEYLENYEVELAKALISDLGKESAFKIAKYIFVMD